MLIEAVSGWAAAKALTAGGCLWGAWATYRTMPMPAIKARLMDCFRTVDLCTIKKTKEREIRKYPTINRVYVRNGIIYLVFTLPTGLDPRDLIKHLYVFKQTFGENIELDGTSKVFTLKVLGDTIKSFDYKYEDIQKIVEKFNLPIICGKSADGWEAYDMTTYPMLLITGETGSGKSTILRAILTCLIQTMQPTNLHLYLADMKRSEFPLFRGVAHVQGKIAKSVDELEPILKSIRKELTKRGDMLDKYEEAHIDDLPDDVRPPYILLCIDEFALLKGERDAWDLIEEIASIGRALGVFLILSCLRPSKEVMDGNLKNNLTVRMAFKASDEIASRITLGWEGRNTGEAAYIKNEERGKFILKLNGYKKVQAPHLKLDDAKAILKPFKAPKPKPGEPIDIEHHEVEEAEQLRLEGFDDDDAKG